MKIIRSEELDELLDYLSKSPENNIKQLNIDQLISTDDEANFQDEEEKISNNFDCLVNKLKQLGLNQEVKFTYSGIANSIYKDISNNEKENKFAEIQTNIQYITNKLEKLKAHETDNIIVNLYKLGEYIRVDYLRFRAINDTKIELEKSKNELKEKIEEVKKELDEFEEKIEEVKKELEKINNKYKKASDSIKKTQASHITILGIFASIILAFVANMTFSSSILQNIDKPNTLKLVSVMCFLGVFIVNILNLLFNFIREIHLGQRLQNGCCSKIWLFNIIMILIATICLIKSFYYEEKIRIANENNSTINVNATNISFSVKP